MEPGSVDTVDPFHLALDSLPDGVLLVDAGATIVVANRALEQQFGYARGALNGQPVERLLPGGLRVGGAAATARHHDGRLVPVEIGVHATEAADSGFVAASIVPRGERHQVDDDHQRAIEEQLEFERLVARLSSQFINLPADRIDDAIRGALGVICGTLGLDRSTFYKISAEGILHDPVSWQRDGVPALPAPVSARIRFPWALERAYEGESIIFSTVSEIPSEIDREGFRAFGIKSGITIPLSVAGQVVGAVGFNSVHAERTWPPEVLHRLKVAASVFAQVLARRQADASLRTALAEVERLKNDLHAENLVLRRAARQLVDAPHIVGQSAAVRHVLELVEQVAATDSSVLILGETGTGKELFATRIHELGHRHHKPIVRVNCAAIPATLIESELFGREKGAFTGALSRQVGRFELADGSTIFLDEIGDLPPDVQVKLLRVLEQRQIERLGNPRPIPVNVRIIAATHRDLERQIAAGTFREDLYYRLNVFPIRVPPLRERTEDIPLLVWRFVEEFSKAFGRRIDAINPDSMAALQLYSWPGNIRELRNVVERAMIAAPGPRLVITLPPSTATTAKRSAKLLDVEREHIRGVLERAGWRIRGAGGAAEQLGLKPTTLETRMAKLGLKRPGPS